MNIGLVDVDSHNFPNIPLMKISAFYKNKNDHVEFAIPGIMYDKVYISKIFTESKEPNGIIGKEIYKGGSGYDLKNSLDHEIEHIYPDYDLYKKLTVDTAFGMLTKGCPRCNHKFCITPIKDGCISHKHCNINEFWNGQKNLVLLDQNILACKDRIELLDQIIETHAVTEFNGGLDIRFLNDEIISKFKQINVKDYHFAWDDPKEYLVDKFIQFKESGLKNTNQVGVYVLVNFWSSHFEDLYRIYTLRALGYMPFVMIYNKQKYVDNKGRWLNGVENRFTADQLRHFKVCQHMQRWCGNRKLIKSSPNFDTYEPYFNWIRNGSVVPELDKQMKLFI